jgi:Xaa-Pro aminopeptidase
VIDGVVQLAAELRSRAERVRAVLRARGLGTLIVYEPAQHAPARCDQVFYLTDFRALGGAMLLLPVRGEPTLVLAPSWDRPRAAAAAGVGEAVAVPPAQLASRAAELARMLPQPIALAGRALLRGPELTQLLGGLSAEPVDGEDVVPPLAALRSPFELERLTRAAAIADIGFNAIRQLARSGMREYELAAEVEAVVQGEGAEDNAGFLASGSVVHLRPPGDRRLERGDKIVATIAPMYRGYVAQLSRTFVLGPPNDAQKRASLQLAKLHALRLRGIGPGARYDGSPIPLARGMTVVVDSSREVAGIGLLACADTVVVDDGGCRALGATPPELFWGEG